MYTAVFIGKPAKYGSYYAYGPFVVFRTLAKFLPTLSPSHATPGVLLGVCVFSLLLCCVIFFCEFYRRSGVSVPSTIVVHGVCMVTLKRQSVGMGCGFVALLFVCLCVSVVLWR